MAKDNTLTITSVSPAVGGKTAVIGINGANYDPSALIEAINTAKTTRATGTYSETVPALDPKAEAAPTAATAPTAGG